MEVQIGGKYYIAMWPDGNWILYKGKPQLKLTGWDGTLVRIIGRGLVLKDWMKSLKEVMQLNTFEGGLMKENRYDAMHMDVAHRVSQESKCPRTQVGCVLVLESQVTVNGYNGHASGGPNEWEYSPDGNPEVIHSEANSLGKCLEQGLSTKGATMYVTLSPCLECSKLLVRAGVKRVVYRDEYRKTDGIDYLKKYNVKVEQYLEA